MKYKICFSITCHEGIDSLRRQILTISAFCDFEHAFVIHLSHSMQIGSREQEVLDSIMAFGNVFLNPDRLQTIWGKAMTQLISNMEFSKSLDYEYICLLSSNETFFRPGVYDYVRNYDYGNYHLKSDAGLMSQQKHADCVSFSQSVGMSGQTFTGQHEGTFYRKELALQIADLILGFRKIEEMNYLGDTTEEVFLPTAAYVVCLGKKQGLPISVIHDRISSIFGTGYFPDTHNSCVFMSILAQKGRLDFESVYHEYPTDFGNCFSLKRVNRLGYDPLLDFVENNLKTKIE